MAEVNRKPWQTRMEIHALSIPACKPMNRKRVTQVVRARFDSTAGRLEIGVSKQFAQRALRSRDRKAATIDTDEHVVVGLLCAPDEMLSRAKAFRELRRKGRMHRHPT